MNPKSQNSRQKYSPEFRRKALAKLKTTENVSELARELGIRRKWLYQWRAEAEAAQKQTVRQESAAVRAKVKELERLVARQALELDFFKGALQRIEERRKRAETSEPTSTSKSSTQTGSKAN